MVVEEAKRERMKFSIYASAVGHNPGRRAIGNSNWQIKGQGQGVRGQGAGGRRGRGLGDRRQRAGGKGLRGLRFWLVIVIG